MRAGLRPSLAVVTFVMMAGATMATAGDADAQAVPRGEPATQGVRNPSIGVAGDADASAVERDPALLGYLRSWSGVYLHTELDGNGTVGGRGDGFFFAMPIPYVSSLVAAGAVQLVRPPIDFPYRDLAKISLALSWRLHPLLSLGIHYAHLAASAPPVAPGVDTVDLAAAGRLGRYLSWGLVVRDLPSPGVGGVPMQRVYDAEVATRPLGTNRLEVAIGARFGERRGDVDPRLRLWAVPWPGVTIKADVEWRRDVDLDGVPENDVRTAVGLQLDLEHVGVAGFGLFGRESGQSRAQGFSLVARVSGERYPAFWRGPRYLERIELSSELKGRRLVEVLDRLRVLEHDPDVAGVILLGGELGAGWAAAEELRAALLRLRRSGRHVLAYLLHGDSKGYLVASAAERVVMDPAGDLGLTGPAFTLPFFKGTGELFGIRADFLRIGPYKSASERYTNAAPSPESRAARETYLDDLDRHLVEALAVSRHLTTAQVHKAIDSAPHSPSAALALGLIDEVRRGEDLGSVLEKQLGRSLAIRDAPRSPARPDAFSRSEIAVLHVDGDLVSGPSRNVPILGLRATGYTELASALEAAVRDDHVRAIVLRIDSPGGSSLAADLFNRAVEAARGIKPVVCSLGDTAASGGYYIAAACDEIFAAPSTLTGSIGIYTGKLDFAGLLAKLGVSLTALGRGAHAGLDSPFRPYSDDERVALLKLLRYHYQRFVAAVARGRHRAVVEIERLAEGRIYSGDRARALGLVDHHGGLAEAVEAAAKAAHIAPTVPIKILPQPPTLLGQLGRLLGMPAKQSPGPQTGLPTLEELSLLLPSSLVFEPSVPQARMDTP